MKSGLKPEKSGPCKYIGVRRMIRLDSVCFFGEDGGKKEESSEFSIYHHPSSIVKRMAERKKKEDGPCKVSLRFCILPLHLSSSSISFLFLDFL